MSGRPFTRSATAGLAGHVVVELAVAAPTHRAHPGWWNRRLQKGIVSARGGWAPQQP
ncbi:MAG TPA: hypothetical protein VGO95_01490 [Modestobacter sp.]|nr:hypothetical protein [Modestobacter sp.]